MPRALVPAHTRIVNHFNKETFVFTDPVESEALSKFDVILEKGGSGAAMRSPISIPRRTNISTSTRAG
ncbi:Hypothetical protein RG1141_CH20690 [Neorhizobium galegae bv. officinalis bv. officinalis str. HAMBI 1141]|uniref:Uncharacterized protein n=1 Tax=Neorhizobium galegae bv. officinalis bv. officinalis str. HAMBI 1141 TaxID=1028801 RepID=A0A068T7K2_NEOGA|nr:hypothetical protein [Neorhizobium galegae]CDN54408.1 Hypothetical protein RG1141_CH20690 [Neorhizobium galegae bv. officinalis bv. officinalis str. HAMBI 1141]